MVHQAGSVWSQQSVQWLLIVFSSCRQTSFGIKHFHIREVITYQAIFRLLYSCLKLPHCRWENFLRDLCMCITFPSVHVQSCLRTTHPTVDKHRVWSWSSSFGQTGLHFWNCPGPWWAWSSRSPWRWWWSCPRRCGPAGRRSRLPTFWRIHRWLLWNCRILSLRRLFQEDVLHLLIIFTFHPHLRKNQYFVQLLFLNF